MQFLKQTCASIVGSIAGVLLFFTLGTSALVLLLFAGASQDEGPVVEDKTVIVFDLSMQIKDSLPPSSLGQVISGQEIKVMTLRQVLDSLEKATNDERIVGIFLDGTGGTSIGYANLSEVRTALEKFRAAGKKIIAYDVDWSEKEYYLGSMADTIFINPMGGMEMNGISSEQLFLTGALEKYGVGVQVIKVGKYKGAVEAYTRKELSPENRQQIEELLGDIWRKFISTVAASREGITAEKLQEIADKKGFLLAEAAQKEGLVDEIAYLDEVVVKLKELTESDAADTSFRQIGLKSYVNAPIRNKAISYSENKIALIYAEGSIVSGEGGLEQIGSDRLVQQLRSLREDEAVKAVVIRLNSPGGSATASDIILRELQLVKEEKPVIISMGNVAASGGYWIATGADYILAESNTVTGSIGVFGLLFNVQEVGNNNGLTWDVVKTGNLADMDTNIRPKTAAELAIYQQYVDKIYETFLEKVAKSRNLPKEKVNEIAQGRVWSGEDAKEIGLIDEIGGLEAAINYAAEKAGLGDDWEIEEYPEKRSLEAEILARLTDAQAQAKQLDPLTTEYLKFRENLGVLQSLNDPKSIYTRLPFNLLFD